MVLSWGWRFIALFTAIRDRIKLAVNRFDWHFHAAICGMHFELAVFADGHASLRG